MQPQNVVAVELWIYYPPFVPLIPMIELSDTIRKLIELFLDETRRPDESEIVFTTRYGHEDDISGMTFVPVRFIISHEGLTASEVYRAEGALDWIRDHSRKLLTHVVRELPD